MTKHVEKHEHESPEPTAHKSLRRAWWLWGFAAVVVVAVALLGIHTSSLRYRFDPVQAVADRYHLATARSVTDKASAELTIADSRLADFNTVYAKDHNSALLQPLANSMVYHDQQAMKYMDTAKKSGLDIKKNGLVKRLCGDLEVQNQSLTAAKASSKQVAELWDHAEAMEDEANGTVPNLDNASGAVQQGLNEAMGW